MSSRGIYYEKKRNRYRVRLYHKHEVVHLSYHPTETEAEETLTNAKLARAARIVQLEVHSTGNIVDILHTLRELTSAPRKLA